MGAGLQGVVEHGVPAGLEDVPERRLLVARVSASPSRRSARRLQASSAPASSKTARPSRGEARASAWWWKRISTAASATVSIRRFSMISAVVCSSAWAWVWVICRLLDTSRMPSTPPVGVDGRGDAGEELVAFEVVLVAHHRHRALFGQRGADGVGAHHRFGPGMPGFRDTRAAFSRKSESPTERRMTPSRRPAGSWMRSGRSAGAGAP
jgi:hypothetical protein